MQGCWTRHDDPPRPALKLPPAGVQDSSGPSPARDGARHTGEWMMSDKVAKLSLDGKTYDLPVHKPTVGPDGLWAGRWTPWGGEPANRVLAASTTSGVER